MRAGEIRQILEQQNHRKFDYLLTLTEEEGFLLNEEPFEEYSFIPPNHVWLLKGNLQYKFQYIQQLSLGNSTVFILRLIETLKESGDNVEQLREEN